MKWFVLVLVVLQVAVVLSGLAGDESTAAEPDKTPGEDAKPEEAAKPEEGAKPDEAAKPDEGAKPSEDAKPSEVAEPAAEEKPSQAPPTGYLRIFTITLGDGGNADFFNGNEGGNIYGLFERNGNGYAYIP